MQAKQAKNVPLQSGEKFFSKKLVTKRTKQQKNVRLLWCRVIFSAKSFFEIEPNGKKMCTYMVGGERVDKLKSL